MIKMPQDVHHRFIKSVLHGMYLKNRYGVTPVDNVIHIYLGIMYQERSIRAGDYYQMDRIKPTIIKKTNTLIVEITV